MPVATRRIARPIPHLDARIVRASQRSTIASTQVQCARRDEIEQMATTLTLSGEWEKRPRCKSQVLYFTGLDTNDTYFTLQASMQAATTVRAQENEPRCKRHIRSRENGKRRLDANSTCALVKPGKHASTQIATTPLRKQTLDASGFCLLVQDDDCKATQHHVMLYKFALYKPRRQYQGRPQWQLHLLLLAIAICAVAKARNFNPHRKQISTSTHISHRKRHTTSSRTHRISIAIQPHSSPPLPAHPPHRRITPMQMLRSAPRLILVLLLTIALFDYLSSCYAQAAVESSDIAPRITGSPESDVAERATSSSESDIAARVSTSSSENGNNGGREPSPRHPGRVHGGWSHLSTSLTLRPLDSKTGPESKVNLGHLANEFKPKAKYMARPVSATAGSSSQTSRTRKAAAKPQSTDALAAQTTEPKKTNRGHKPGQVTPGAWWKRIGGKPNVARGTGRYAETRAKNYQMKKAAKAAAAAAEKPGASLDQHPPHHGGRPPSPGGGGNGHGPGGAAGGIAVRKRAGSSGKEHPPSPPSEGSSGSKPHAPLGVHPSRVHLLHVTSKPASEKPPPRQRRPNLNIEKRPRGRPFGSTNKPKTTDDAASGSKPVAKRPSGRPPGPAKKFESPLPTHLTAKSKQPAWWNQVGGRPRRPPGSNPRAEYQRLRYQKQKAEKQKAAAEKQGGSLDQHPAKHGDRPPSPGGNGHGPGGSAGGIAVRKRASPPGHDRSPSPSSGSDREKSHSPQRPTLSHVLYGTPGPASDKARPRPKHIDLNFPPRPIGRPPGSRTKPKTSSVASGSGAKRPLAVKPPGRPPKVPVRHPVSSDAGKRPAGRPTVSVSGGTSKQALFNQQKHLAQKAALQKGAKKPGASFDQHPSKHGGHGGGGNGHGPGGAAGGVAARKRATPPGHERPPSPSGESGQGSHSPQQVNLGHLVHNIRPLGEGVKPPERQRRPNLNAPKRPIGRPPGSRNKPKTTEGASGSKSKTTDAASGSSDPVVKRPRGRPKGTPNRPKNTDTTPPVKQPPTAVKEKAKPRSWWNRPGGKPSRPQGTGYHLEYAKARYQKQKAAKQAAAAKEGPSLDEHPSKHGGRPPSPGGGGGSGSGSGHGPGGAAGGIAVSKRASPSDKERPPSPSSGSGGSGGSPPHGPQGVNPSRLHHLHVAPLAPYMRRPGKPKLPDLNVAADRIGRPKGSRNKPKTTDAVSGSQSAGPSAKRLKSSAPADGQKDRKIGSWWNRAGGKPNRPRGTGYKAEYEAMRYQKKKAAKQAAAAGKSNASLDEHPSKHGDRPHSPGGGGGGNGGGHGPGGAAGGIAVRKRASPSDKERPPSPPGGSGGQGDQSPKNKGVDLRRLLGYTRTRPAGEPTKMADLNTEVRRPGRPSGSRNKPKSTDAALTSDSKPVTKRPRGRQPAGSSAVDPSAKTPKTSHPAQSPEDKPKKVSWWNRPGGRPNRQKGSGYRAEYERGRYQKKKAAKLEAAAKAKAGPSSDEHPSKHRDRPPSPGGPGGAAGGVAAYKRASSSSDEHAKHPPPHGHGQFSGHGANVPPQHVSPSHATFHTAQQAQPLPQPSASAPRRGRPPGRKLWQSKAAQARREKNAAELEMMKRPAGKFGIDRLAAAKPSAAGPSSSRGRGSTKEKVVPLLNVARLFPNRPADPKVSKAKASTEAVQGPKKIGRPKRAGQWWKKPGGQPPAAKGFGPKSAKSLDQHPSKFDGRPPSPGGGGGGNGHGTGGAAGGLAAYKRASSSSDEHTAPSSHGHGESSGHGAKSPPRQPKEVRPSGSATGRSGSPPPTKGKTLDLNVAIKPKGRPPGKVWQSKASQDRAKQAAAAKPLPAGKVPLSRTATAAPKEPAAPRRGRGRPPSKLKTPDLNIAKRPAGRPLGQKEWQSKAWQERARKAAAAATSLPAGKVPLSRLSLPVGKTSTSRLAVAKPVQGMKKAGTSKAGEPWWQRAGGQPPKSRGSGPRAEYEAVRWQKKKAAKQKDASLDQHPSKFDRRPPSPGGGGSGSGHGSGGAAGGVAAYKRASTSSPDRPPTPPSPSGHEDSSGHGAKSPPQQATSPHSAQQVQSTPQPSESRPRSGRPPGKASQFKATQDREMKAAGTKPAPNKGGRPKATQTWWNRAGGRPNRPQGTSPRIEYNKVYWQKYKGKKKAAPASSPDKHASTFDGRPPSPGGGGNGHDSGGAAEGVATRKRKRASSSSEGHAKPPSQKSSPKGHEGASGHKAAELTGSHEGTSGHKAEDLTPPQTNMAHLVHQMQSARRPSDYVPKQRRPGRPQGSRTRKTPDLNRPLLPSGLPAPKVRKPGGRPQIESWWKRPGGQPPRAMGTGPKFKYKTEHYQKLKEKKKAAKSLDQHPSKLDGRPPSPGGGGGNGHGPQGGAAGGVAARKRSSSSEEHPKSPSPKPSPKSHEGTSGHKPAQPTPVQFRLGHLAHQMLPSTSPTPPQTKMGYLAHQLQSSTRPSDYVPSQRRPGRPKGAVNKKPPKTPDLNRPTLPSGLPAPKKGGRPKVGSWWKVPGGQPPRAIGTGPKVKSSSKQYQKLKEKKAAAKSLDQHPSKNLDGRPPSPGGGGAAGGVAARKRKRASSSSDEHLRTPSPKGSGERPKPPSPKGSREHPRLLSPKRHEMTSGRKETGGHGATTVHFAHQLPSSSRPSDYVPNRRPIDNPKKSVKKKTPNIPDLNTPPKRPGRRKGSLNKNTPKTPDLNRPTLPSGLPAPKPRGGFKGQNRGPWWQRAGGKPPRAMGTGPLAKYSRASYQKQKEKKAAAKQLDEHPSRHSDRPPSPGGAGDGGAAGGVAVRRRTSSSDERPKSPSPKGKPTRPASPKGHNGPSGHKAAELTPPQFRMSHLAPHLQSSPKPSDMGPRRRPGRPTGSKTKIKTPDLNVATLASGRPAPKRAGRPKGVSWWQRIGGQPPRAKGTSPHAEYHKQRYQKLKEKAGQSLDQHGSQPEGRPPSPGGSGGNGPQGGAGGVAVRKRAGSTSSDEQSKSSSPEGGSTKHISPKGHEGTSGHKVAELTPPQFNIGHLAHELQGSIRPSDVGPRRRPGRPKGSPNKKKTFDLNVEVLPPKGRGKPKGVSWWQRAGGQPHRMLGTSPRLEYNRQRLQKLKEQKEAKSLDQHPSKNLDGRPPSPGGGGNGHGPPGAGGVAVRKRASSSSSDEHPKNSSPKDHHEGSGHPASASPKDHKGSREHADLTPAQFNIGHLAHQLQRQAPKPSDYVPRQRRPGRPKGAVNRKTPDLNVATSPSGDPIVKKAGRPKGSLWWKMAGGQPPRASGTSPRVEYNRKQTQRAKEKKQAAKSLDQHPSKLEGRPPSPGGSGDGHGPGGAAGGVAARKRSSSPSSDEQPHSPSPHGQHSTSSKVHAGSSGRDAAELTPPQLSMGHLAHHLQLTKASDLPPSQKGRGRPKGSLNKKIPDLNIATSLSGKPIVNKVNKVGRPKGKTWWSEAGGKPNRPQGTGPNIESNKVRWQKTKAQKQAAAKSLDQHPSSLDRRPPSPGGGGGNGHGPQGSASGIAARKRKRASSSSDEHSRPPSPKGHEGSSKHDEEITPPQFNMAHVTSHIRQQAAKPSDNLSRRIGRPPGSKTKVKTPDLNIAMLLSGRLSAKKPMKKAGRPKATTAWWQRVGGQPNRAQGTGPKHEYEVAKYQKKKAMKKAAAKSLDQHPSKFDGRPPSPGGGGGNGHGPHGAAGGVAARKRATSSSSDEHAKPPSPKGHEGSSGPATATPSENVKGQRGRGRPPGSRNKKVATELTPPQFKMGHVLHQLQSSPKATDVFRGQRRPGRPTGSGAVSRNRKTPDLNVPLLPSGLPAPKKMGRPKETQAWWQKAGGQPQRPAGTAPSFEYNKQRYQKLKEKKAAKSLDEHPSKEFDGRPPSPGGGGGHGHGPHGGAAGGVAVRKRAGSSSDERPSPKGGSTKPASPKGHEGPSGHAAATPSDNVTGQRGRGRGRPPGSRNKKVATELTPPQFKMAHLAHQLHSSLKPPSMKASVVGPSRPPGRPKGSLNKKNADPNVAALKPAVESKKVRKPRVLESWWKRPGGVPNRPKGTAPTLEQSRKYYEKQKEQKAAKSLDQHPSKFDGRPPSPGGGGNGHGPHGGAHGGIAVRKRASSSSGERPKSPSPKGQEGSSGRPKSPPQHTSSAHEAHELEAAPRRRPGRPWGSKTKNRKDPAAAELTPPQLKLGHVAHQLAALGPRPTTYTPGRKPGRPKGSATKVKTVDLNTPLQPSGHLMKPAIGSVRKGRPKVTQQWWQKAGGVPNRVQGTSPKLEYNKARYEKLKAQKEAAKSLDQHPSKFDGRPPSPGSGGGHGHGHGPGASGAGIQA